jgi:outer membrane receptor protein involved in Fe transport
VTPKVGVTYRVTPQHSVYASVGGGIEVPAQAALAWTDHRYTHYLVDSVHYGSPGNFADYSGNRVVGVPSLTGAFALDVTPAAVQPLRVRLAVESMSSFFADDANLVQVPAYRLANLTVGTDDALRLGGAGVGINAFVTIHNLFDRRYIASAYLNPDVVAGEPVAFEPGLPRNIVVGVSLVTR